MNVIVMYRKEKPKKPTPITADDYFDSALRLEADGEVRQAIDNYKRALDKNPSHCQSLENLGAIFSRQRKFVQAETHYKRAIRARRNDASGYFNLGNLYDEMGKNDPRKKDLAEEYYRYAIRIGNWPDAHYNLACLLLDRGDLFESLSYFTRYLKISLVKDWYHHEAGRSIKKIKSSLVIKGGRDKE